MLGVYRNLDILLKNIKIYTQINIELQILTHQIIASLFDRRVRKLLGFDYVPYIRIASIRSAYFA